MSAVFEVSERLVWMNGLDELNLKFSNFLNGCSRRAERMSPRVLEFSKILLAQVNPQMVPQLEAAGLRFVGRDETGQRMEVRGTLLLQPS